MNDTPVTESDETDLELTSAIDRLAAADPADAPAQAEAIAQQLGAELDPPTDSVTDPSPDTTDT